MIFEGSEPNYRISPCRQYLLVKHTDTAPVTYELRQYCAVVHGLKSAGEAATIADNLEQAKILGRQAALVVDRPLASTLDAASDSPERSPE
jgi:hypothetical protein